MRTRRLLHLTLQLLEHRGHPVDLLRLAGQQSHLFHRTPYGRRHLQTAGHKLHRKNRCLDQRLQKPCTGDLMLLSEYGQLPGGLLPRNSKHKLPFFLRRCLLPKRKYRAQRLHCRRSVSVPHPERQRRQLRFRPCQLCLDLQNILDLLRCTGCMVCDPKHIPFFRMVASPKRDEHNIPWLQFFLQPLRYPVLKALIQTAVRDIDDDIRI